MSCSATAQFWVVSKNFFCGVNWIFDSPITGTGSLRFSGTESFFNSVNTYSGPTTISSGSLNVGINGQLGSGAYAGLITNNGSGYVQVFIRGVGNTIFVGADPSVATFIDDVPRIYSSLVNSFVNVERVEVLPFHQLGRFKWERLGMDYHLRDAVPPPRETIDQVLARFREAGLKAV